METTIYARVVAKAISFPDDIEVQYFCLDEKERLTGKSYGPLHFTWEDVKSRFWIDLPYAEQCEKYFRDGDAAFLGNKHLTIKRAE